MKRLVSRSWFSYRPKGASTPWLLRENEKGIRVPNVYCTTIKVRKATLLRERKEFNKMSEKTFSSNLYRWGRFQAPKYRQQVAFLFLVNAGNLADEHGLNHRWCIILWPEHLYHLFGDYYGTRLPLHAYRTPFLLDISWHKDQYFSFGLFRGIR